MDTITSIREDSPTTASHPAVAMVAAGAITLWGGTAVANKIAVGHMDAMTAGVLRSMLAGCLGLVLAFGMRLPLPRSRKEITLQLISGISSFAVWPMLLSLGLGWTTANHAALIMAPLPVLTGLIGSVVARRAPGRGWWTGMSMAMGGTVLLVFYRSGGGLFAEGGSLTGDLVILAGILICAAGYVAGGRLSLSIGTWATTFWGLASALVVLVPAFVILAGRTDWTSVGAAGWGAIAYMAVLSSIVGYAGWFWALGRGGVARIASWQLMQPVLTLIFAAWILGETVTVQLAVSAAAILAGTAIAQRGGAKKECEAL